MRKKAWILMMCVGGALMVTSCSSSSSQETTAAATAAQETTTESETTVEATTEPETAAPAASTEDLQNELLAEYAREKYMRECETVGYKDLMRYEDEHKGKKLYIIAQIVQKMDEGYRCFSNDGDEYFINDIREYDTTKILVDDVTVIWGDYAGVTKMTRAGNYVSEEVPVIDARYIDIYDEAKSMEDYITASGSQKADSSYVETTQASTTYETMYVVNCNESITLRTSPSTQASEICQIPLGAAVSFMEGADSGFYKVSYLGKTGYALASYLSYQAPEITSPMYSTMRVVNCNESITLRTSPSTKASEIRQIPLGAVVSYIESASNGFYKVSYLGSTGYALASYLEFE